MLLIIQNTFYTRVGVPEGIKFCTYISRYACIRWVQATIMHLFFWFAFEMVGPLGANWLLSTYDYDPVRLQTLF